MSLSVGVPGLRAAGFGTGMETWPYPLLMGGGLGLFSIPIYETHIVPHSSIKDENLCPSL